MAEKKKKNEWLEWGKAILIACVLTFFIKTFVLSTSIVVGESMDPTLLDGDKLLFNKFVYLIGEPDRGDVVIIQNSYKNYVKRIIALPGETIQVKDHILYINDKQNEEHFLNKEANENTGNFGPIIVPDDSYFVMGDNRAISIDSRNGLGFIKEDHIIGRSEFIFYPFDGWTMIK